MMPMSHRGTRCSLVLPTLAALVLLRSAGAAIGQSEPVFSSDYLHVAYNIGANSPVRVYDGKIALDLTTPERWLQVLGELADLGVNVTTPLTSYGPQTIYPTRIPGLKQCTGWQERGLDGLQMLLDACEKTGIDCYPAVWLFRAATPELSAQAQQELVELYGSHPAFKGLVPPVEANPQGGFESQDFVKLARQARQAGAGFTVMDFPNGPFSFEIIQTIMARALSGTVDVENVQYHPSDYRWDGDFLFARGLFHLVMGICPGIKSIVHTHYKYGGGLRWIELDDPYRVHQAATITATPDGTSIYSFLHSQWGNASSYNYDDPLPRRLAWYKGIVNSQRMLPYLEDARPANAVAILVPRYLRDSSLALLNRVYVPLARAGIGVHCFLNDTNIGNAVRGIVVQNLRECSREQLLLLQRFVADGGTACILQRPDSGVTYDISDRARQVLGLSVAREWEPSGVDPEFARALGLDDATGKVTLDTAHEAAYGAGTVQLIPARDDEETARRLLKWAQERVPVRVTARNLPDGFVMDRWRKQDGRTDVDMVMFMGTRDGAHGTDVRLRIPRDKAPGAAYLLTPDSAVKLATTFADGAVQLTVSELTDEFNAVILTDGTYPFMVPQARVIRCKAGQSVPVAFSIMNALAEPFEAQVRISAPRGWDAAAPSESAISLAPGESIACASTVTVPEDAVRKPHFVRIECSGLVQRVMLFPEDGSPQVFSDLKPEDLPEASRPAAAARPAPVMGTEWAAVEAGDPTADNPAAHRGGVCFLPGKEWDKPAEQDGKPARYGERLPRLAAPNFLVNDPPPQGDFELRITYWTASGGIVHVFDGKTYHDVANLNETGKWATVTATVVRGKWDTETADRPSYPGRNIMFDVDCASVYVHKIEVRAIPSPAPDE